MKLIGVPSTKDVTDHTPAPASSVNPSTSKNDTVVLRGKEYSLEIQGAEFLTDAFHIRLPEAKSILEGVSPDYLPKIVSSLRESWERIKDATDKPAYIRGIVSKVTPTGNGKVQAQGPNIPATPTRPTPPPVTPAPSPLPPGAAKPAAPEPVGGGEKGYQNGGEVVPCQGGRSE